MGTVVDICTRLPHGHLANRGHDMAHHARVLASAAEDLRRAMAELGDLSAKVAADLRAVA